MALHLGQSIVIQSQSYVSLHSRIVWLNNIMIKLFCVIVGVKGSAFPVDIDTTESVGDLKDAIKAKKANALKNVGVRNLQLSLRREQMASGSRLA
ncbi:hypothetical protein KXD40_000987 [Peronospora effusa]|nr:hypothetical protein KXD40_000987 [Peronospora effusa]